VIALELDPRYVTRLTERFAHIPGVEVVEGSATDWDLVVGAAGSRIDSVMSFNVLEHIPDDVSVLRNVHDALPEGGRFVCFVPAFPGIYGAMDHALGHVRRYTKGELLAKVRGAGFVVVELRFVSFPGYFIWLFNGRVLRSRGVAGGARSVWLYDRCVVPLIRALERRWAPPLGQSLLVVAERSKGQSREAHRGLRALD
jgi:SAM-dependent methyltransferase